MLFEVFLICCFILMGYLLVCYSIILVASKWPRNPYPDKPDWGTSWYTRVPTRNNKSLDCTVVFPEENMVISEEKIKHLKMNAPTAIFCHGWGRDKHRMLPHARFFKNLGFITILFSVRDHGNSDKVLRGMNIIRFSQDIEAVIDWWGSDCILIGHSIGGGASLLAASRQKNRVKGVIAEAPPYAFPHALKNVYSPGLKQLTFFFLPGLRLLLKIRYFHIPQQDYSPFHADIQAPTLLVHGEADSMFPIQHSQILEAKLPNAALWVVEGRDHFNLVTHPEYEERIGAFVQSIPFSLAQNQRSL